MTYSGEKRTSNCEQFESMIEYSKMSSSIQYYLGINLVGSKMDFLKYMDRIEDKIGQKIEGTDKNLADRITEEPWFDVLIRDLNQIAMEVAKEIEQQTKIDINKGTYRLHQHEAPFARLLALEIILSAWLGWILNEKEIVKAKRIPTCSLKISIWIRLC